MAKTRAKFFFRFADEILLLSVCAKAKNKEF